MEERRILLVLFIVPCFKRKQVTATKIGVFISVKIQSVGNYLTLILLLKREAKSVQ
jgi:hypothetical protein